VRRILKALERQGLVTIHQGRHGGVTLERAPEDISLEDIYKAVGDESGLFAFRQQGNPRCPVNRSMKGLLTPVFAAANAAVQDSMRRTTLATLVGKIG
jgi:Rrf2 family protein